MRLSTEESRQKVDLPAPRPPLAALPPKLTYNLKDLREALGISSVTLYRLELRGLLKPLPYFRHKVYSRAEVERFLAGQGGDRRPLERTGAQRKRTE